MDSDLIVFVLTGKIYQNDGFIFFRPLVYSLIKYSYLKSMREIFEKVLSASLCLLPAQRGALVPLHKYFSIRTCIIKTSNKADKVTRLFSLRFKLDTMSESTVLTIICLGLEGQVTQYNQLLGSVKVAKIECFRFEVYAKLANQNLLKRVIIFSL